MSTTTIKLAAGGLLPIKNNRRQYVTQAMWTTLTQVYYDMLSVTIPEWLLIAKGGD
ncbi:hypothetical protein [Gimesia maris]|uniref:hypothetical protein n=1 Tax=Gimesia maris TaxID=122 RepID=UPI0032ED2638